jgi:RNA-directed DNA polymerase
MVLEAVYEQDFLSCSYGFRPGRSAHQALNQLSGVITVHRQHWVLDVDIRKYFDSISHSHLREILDQRVTDGVIRRMIGKWLNAGVSRHRPAREQRAWLSAALNGHYAYYRT